MEQNLALDFRADPQALQTEPLGLCCGKSAGSGRGSSPGDENAAAADMIDGGCPDPDSVAVAICDA